jgi:hypothetical protein
VARSSNSGLHTHTHTHTPLTRARYTHHTPHTTNQALDSTYRAAVAALIQRQAASEESPAQFITTTFRPEMVRVADRCYGISLQNKVSSIDVLERETALEFVRELQVRGAQGPDVSCVGRVGSGSG